MTSPAMRSSLYCPPDASPERVKAGQAFDRAVEAVASAETAEDMKRGRSRLATAEKELGEVLLREDRARRPQAYQPPMTSPAIPERTYAGKFTLDDVDLIYGMKDDRVVADLVAHLRELLSAPAAPTMEDVIRVVQDYWREHSPAAGHGTALVAKLRALAPAAPRERETELEEALRPFATAADRAEESSAEAVRFGGAPHSDNATPGWGICLRDLRQARRTLAGERDPSKPPVRTDGTSPGGIEFSFHGDRPPSPDTVRAVGEIADAVHRHLAAEKTFQDGIEESAKLVDRHYQEAVAENLTLRPTMLKSLVTAIRALAPSTSGGK